MTTEVVFSSPDPREAEEIRALLERKGLEPRLYSGPDPVTGVGGHLFGGAGALMFNVEVPVPHAESARDVLSTRPAPAPAPPEDDPPRPQQPLLGRARRFARPAILVYLVLGVLTIPLGWVLDRSSLDVPSAVVVALYALGIVCLAAVLLCRGRSQ